MNQQK